MTPQTQSAPAPPSARVPDGTRGRGRRPSRRVAAAAYPATFLALVVVVWFAVTSTGLVQPYIIPSPVDTWKAFTDNPDYLWGHTLVTTGETVAGFVIAAVVGVLVAVLMVYSPTLEKTFYPLILFAQVIPKIAIAPLFVVWLGFGASPKILVAVLMAFFPVVISGISGLRSVDPELLELTSTMGASRLKTFWKVRFPAALPELLSGLKIAATLAVTGAVVGEFVGANSGLGFVILQANGNIDTAMLFAALIIMSALGVLLFAIIQVAETLLIPWHATRRNRG
ncbi:MULTISPECIES: ABC transporter permease [Nocardiopsis]|uniref:ABC transporter permease n=1 Tax=Nocardiopsis TaxID=2013 RepID=UPI0003451DC5|nr:MULTISPECIES: ABC transporter permease [Nocardiopsis]PWV52354.1 NitT/TauT family transport system permease protein [Nocardiopsis sp. L17-MgMaSL7]